MINIIDFSNENLHNLAVKQTPVYIIDKIYQVNPPRFEVTKTEIKTFTLYSTRDVPKVEVKNLYGEIIETSPYEIFLTKEEAIEEKNRQLEEHIERNKERWIREIKELIEFYGITIDELERGVLNE